MIGCIKNTRCFKAIAGYIKIECGRQNLSHGGGLARPIIGASGQRRSRAVSILFSTFAFGLSFSVSSFAQDPDVTPADQPSKHLAREWGGCGADFAVLSAASSEVVAQFDSIERSYMNWQDACNKEPACVALAISIEKQLRGLSASFMELTSDVVLAKQILDWIVATGNRVFAGPNGWIGGQLRVEFITQYLIMEDLLEQAESRMLTIALAVKEEIPARVRTHPILGPLVIPALSSLSAANLKYLAALNLFTSCATLTAKDIGGVGVAHLFDKGFRNPFKLDGSGADPLNSHPYPYAATIKNLDGIAPISTRQGEVYVEYTLGWAVPKDAVFLQDVRGKYGRLLVAKGTKLVAMQNLVLDGTPNFYYDRVNGEYLVQSPQMALRVMRDSSNSAEIDPKVGYICEDDDASGRRIRPGQVSTCTLRTTITGSPDEIRSQSRVERVLEIALMTHNWQRPGRGYRRLDLTLSAAKRAPDNCEWIKDYENNRGYWYCDEGTGIIIAKPRVKARQILAR